MSTLTNNRLYKKKPAPCTYYDNNDEYNGDFDVLPPHGSGQAFAGFLESEGLGSQKE